MKRFLAIFISLILISGNVHSQDSKSLLGTEKISIITDRNVYIAGETLHYFVILSQLPANTISYTILYFEIITPSGKQVMGKKYKIDQAGLSGSQLIPTGIKSGYYYLRGYTKSMKSKGPECFGYKLIKIVNAENGSVLDESMNDPSLLNFSLKKPEKTSLINIDLSDSIPSPRSEFSVDLRFIGEDPPANVCLSVVPYESIFASLQLECETKQEWRNNLTIESNGQMLTGTVVAKST